MSSIHECQCENCQQAEEHPEQRIHQQMNLLISRMDEQQRRWYASIEAKKIGHGGATKVSKITGISVETIRRGRNEMDENLESRPSDRIRKLGGGRKEIEKKNQESKPLSSM